MEQEEEEHEQTLLRRSTIDVAEEDSQYLAQQLALSLVWNFPVETGRKIVFLTPVAGDIGELKLQPVQLSAVANFVFPQIVKKTCTI